MLQNRGDVVGEHYDEVTVVQQREAAIHGVELIGDDLDLVFGQTAGDESLTNETGDLARLATATIVVFHDDYMVQHCGEPAELADVLIAPIAWRGDHTDPSPGIDA